MTHRALFLALASSIMLVGCELIEDLIGRDDPSASEPPSVQAETTEAPTPQAPAAQPSPPIPPPQKAPGPSLGAGIASHTETVGGTTETKAPWIVQAMRVGEKIYALRNPVKSGRPADAVRPEDNQLEVHQNIFMTPERPVAQGGQVTLLDEHQTCVGTISGQVDIYMACFVEMEQGQYTKRTGLVVSGCPALVQNEFNSFYWAVEGARTGLKLLGSERVELDEATKAAYAQTIKAYAAQHKLPEATMPQLQVLEASRYPGLSTLEVSIMSDDLMRSILIKGGRVIRHYPERFNLGRYLNIDGRPFIIAMTERECRNVYTTRGDDVVPFNDDCLYLWCGDGLL